MSTLLKSFIVDGKIDTISTTGTRNIQSNRYIRHVLKSRENIFKPKCNKVLKRKLKKYKLRKDGKEDQDVLDVSLSLLHSLKIKSPSKLNGHSSSEESICEGEELRPKNYLFKMARRKQSLKKNEKINTSNITKNISKNIKNNNIECNSSIDEICYENSLTPGSQEKKQTNAFKLLMDSRNKSIGRNSPGKEKTVNELETQEINEKKKLKVKRNLALQKLAEAKGSLKKEEIEKYQDECIKRKMKERADRLKRMISKRDFISTKVDKEPDSLLLKNASITHSKMQENSEIKNYVASYGSEIKAVENFTSIASSSKSIERKYVPKEDDEFLKKLSPSIRKKENMLSYFQKIEKNSELSIDNDYFADKNQVIKVKLTSRIKKKTKKRKLSLNKDVTSDESMACNTNDTMNFETLNTHSEINNSSDNLQEHKYFSEINSGSNNNKNDSVEEVKVNEGRPKRNVKRPIKYTDDVQNFSSDEEYSIFTHKKKKYVETDSKAVKKPFRTDKEENNTVKVNKDKKIKKNNQNKKPMKLAPIFALKSQPDPAAIEAKQKFLQSGVPDILKKVIIQQKVQDVESVNFPTVIHVQQNESIDYKTSITSLFDYYNCDSSEDITVKHNENIFKLLTSINTENNNNYTLLVPKTNVNETLKNIKQSYPKFPVYRTYSSLKGKSRGESKVCNYSVLDSSTEIISGIIDFKNDNPESLNWTDKYKAISANQIIGNFGSIRELRKWLLSWTEIEVVSRDTTTMGSDSSDYYQSDTDSRDSTKSVNNFLILNGPVGSGKTSSVYTVATELAIKVIEVNASSKRTGKIMLQDLQEATQSHIVNRAKGSISIDGSQKSQESSDFSKSIKKLGRSTKTKESSSKKLIYSSAKNSSVSQQSTSQENVRTGMSLILIDDADLVFEQDEGFCSAIAQLIQSSKRPVILVTASLACSHLQRFLNCAKIINMYPLLPKMLGTWLDIMCLSDVGICWPGIGAKFIDFFKGDIRKTINSLQFYMTTQLRNSTFKKEIASQLSDDYKANVDDENSNVSWADCEGLEEKKLFTGIIIDLQDKAWKYFMKSEAHLLHLKHPLELFNIWWSLPTLLNITHDYQSSSEDMFIEYTEDKLKNVSDLEAIVKVTDSMSVLDYFSQIKPDLKSNITSSPWHQMESDSLLEQENLDEFNSTYDVAEEISHYFVTRSIMEAQRTLKCERSNDIYFPGMAAQKERDRVISQHNNLSSFLNPSTVLDRRALALDYWSTCRTICRIEKIKTDNNSKRNNRFCHHLKFLKVIENKNESFDSLCDSLYCNENSSSL